MLRWTVVFLVIALVAGLFGFLQLEGTATWVAKVLFAVFLILFVVSLVARCRRRDKPALPDEGQNRADHTPPPD